MDELDEYMVRFIVDLLNVCDKIKTDTKTEDIINVEISDGAYNNRLEIVNYCVNNGSNINFGLYGACISGNMEMIEYLIKRGATDWNKGLYGGCMGNHNFVVNRMIELGANNYDNALIMICGTDNIEIAKTLISHGAKCANIGVSMMCGCFGKLNNKLMMDLLLKEHVIQPEKCFSVACQMRNKDMIRWLKDRCVGKCLWCNNNIIEHATE